VARHFGRALELRRNPAQDYPESYRWSTRAIALDKSDANKVLTRIRRQWFAKRKSIFAILKEVMTNEAATLVDTDAHNKALEADAALQDLGSDFIGEAYVTATLTRSPISSKRGSAAGRRNGSPPSSRARM
jgi:type IV secretory pathway VirB4 component